MTMPIHINTLEYANKLTAAGIAQPQANAQALALYDALTQSIVVVPDDLTLLKTDILARIDVLKVEVNGRIDAVELSISAKIDALQQRFKTHFIMLYLMSATSLLLNVLVLVKLFSQQS